MKVKKLAIIKIDNKSNIECILEDDSWYVIPILSEDKEFEKNSLILALRNLVIVLEEHTPNLEVDNVHERRLTFIDSY